MSDINQIANDLVQYCRNNEEAKCLDTLYADNAVSVEAFPMPGQDSPETHGLDGIRGKHDWFFSNNEVHSQDVEGPFMHGDNRFGVIFSMDVTDKNSGQRGQMKELGVYTVDNDKIVREEFFYTM